MTSQDFIEALRSDIKAELREEILAELQPEINKRLNGNVMTLAEAARYLKVAEGTLRKMVKALEVPFFIQRKQYFFSQLELDDHIRKITNRPLK
ncbi:helix-turn-helix domain-containing protein [Gorillibacterium sp. sgz500922]|uniref:helix-turn-helix domain-containing protein n=1 Tax=Gorillibacterium sp. sgz500922 TaxID=3446694 RepID=UPI003F66B553